MRTSLVGDYEKRQKEVLGNNGLYNRLEKNNLLVSGLETGGGASFSNFGSGSRTDRKIEIGFENENIKVKKAR